MPESRVLAGYRLPPTLAPRLDPKLAGKQKDWKYSIYELSS